MGGHDIVGLTNGEDEATDETGYARPADKADRQHGVEYTGPEDGYERDENDQDGEGHDGVGYAHDHGINRAAVVAGNAAQDRANGDVQGDGDDSH